MHKIQQFLKEGGLFTSLWQPGLSKDSVICAYIHERKRFHSLSKRTHVTFIGCWLGLTVATLINSSVKDTSKKSSCEIAKLIEENWQLETLHI